MKLTHPDAPGVVVEPKSDHAEAYLSQGWAEKPADEKPKK